MPSLGSLAPTTLKVANKHQKRVLNHLYLSKTYPTHPEIEMMANMLGLQYCNINEWFKAKRRLNKIDSKDQSQPIHLGKMLQYTKCVDIEKLVHKKLPVMCLQVAISRIAKLNSVE